MIDEVKVKIIKPWLDSIVPIPLMPASVPAGFPSPAQDHLDLAIDLNKDLIDNPDATFYGRVSGDSMIGEGIGDGDLMVIDRSVEPKHGHIAVCSIDGDFTLKKIEIDSTGLWLVPSNPKFKRILVKEEDDFIVWGVVKHVIKSF
ncbi:MAG: translesion error-prone DNA polymerase V autoproteolytic subunit [Candidatus Kapaibacteriales bacterium]